MSFFILFCIIVLVNQKLLKQLRLNIEELKKKSFASSNIRTHYSCQKSHRKCEWIFIYMLIQPYWFINTYSFNYLHLNISMFATDVWDSYVTCVLCAICQTPVFIKNILGCNQHTMSVLRMYLYCVMVCVFNLVHGVSIHQPGKLDLIS